METSNSFGYWIHRQRSAEKLFEFCEGLGRRTGRDDGAGDCIRVRRLKQVFGHFSQASELLLHYTYRMKY